MTLRERTKKKVGYWCAIAVLVLIVVACVGYLLRYGWQLKQNEETYENLRVTEVQEETEQVVAEEEIIYCESLYDFDELRQQNEDIYAWVTVPGTQVDYPILQSATDNYYLNRNIDHSQGYPGCIYTNQCNAKEFSDYITVLYGHNMKNGTMFGSIHNFEDKACFNEYDKIYVYTEEMRLTYEIYAAVKFTDVYIPSYYAVTMEQGRDGFINELMQNSNNDVSHIREGVEWLPEDKAIVLSTCVNGEGEKRYLLVGRLVEEAYYAVETEDADGSEQ